MNANVQMHDFQNLPEYYTVIFECPMKVSII